MPHTLYILYPSLIPARIERLDALSDERKVGFEPSCAAMLPLKLVRATREYHKLTSSKELIFQSSSTETLLLKEHRVFNCLRDDGNLSVL